MFLFPSLSRLHNQLSNDRRTDSKNKHLNLQVIQRKKKETARHLRGTQTNQLNLLIILLLVFSMIYNK